jgi:hypothetical protein
MSTGQPTVGDSDSSRAIRNFTQSSPGSNGVAHRRGEYDPEAARVAPEDGGSVAGLIEGYLYWRHHAEQLWRAYPRAAVALTFHRVGGKADCPEGQAAMDFLKARHGEADSRYRDAEWRLVEIVREACGRAMVIAEDDGDEDRLLWPETPCTVASAGYILTAQLHDDGGEGSFLLTVTPRSKVVELDDESGEEPEDEEPGAPPAPKPRPDSLLLAVTDHLRDELDEMIRLKDGDDEDAADRADERYLAALLRFRETLRNAGVAGVIHRGVLLSDRAMDAFDGQKADLDMLSSVHMDLVVEIDA